MGDRSRLTVAIALLGLAASLPAPAAAYLGEADSFSQPRSAPAFDAISAGGNGTVYALRGQQEVVRFARDGTVLAQWGGPGSAPGRFDGATAIVATRDAVYVADSRNDRLQKFAADGSVLAVGDGTGGTPSFESPTHMALDPTGALLVLDAGPPRLISPAGAVVRTLPRIAGRGGLAIGADGSIYFADPLPGLVYRYAPDGTEIGEFGMRGGQPPRRLGEFSDGPTALAVDGSGALWAVDPGGNRLQRFAPDGRANLACGGDTSLFDVPTLVAADPDGSLFVVHGRDTVSRIADQPRPLRPCDATAPRFTRFGLGRRVSLTRRGALSRRTTVRLAGDEDVTLRARLIPVRCPRGRRCTRARGRTLRLPREQRRIRLRTLIRRSSIVPGRYRIVAVARDSSGNRTVLRTRGFTVRTRRS